MQESGTAKALRLLVAAAFANGGYRIKLRVDVFLGVDLVNVAGRLLGLGSRLIGVLVVGLDVLGHDFRLFS